MGFQFDSCRLRSQSIRITFRENSESVFSMHLNSISLCSEFNVNLVDFDLIQAYSGHLQFLVSDSHCRDEMLPNRRVLLSFYLRCSSMLCLESNFTRKLDIFHVSEDCCFLKPSLKWSQTIFELITEYVKNLVLLTINNRFMVIILQKDYGILWKFHVFLE